MAATVGALDGYTTYINNIKLDALPGTTFKWDKMRDTYKNGDSDEGAVAVAELMRYCGQRVMMDYDKEGSAGSVNVFDMVDYFGFSPTAKNVMRFNYTNEAWEKLIYEEVANKRPVLYSGFSDTGGHEFVIDGYDNMGLFHVNWSWSGADDYCVTGEATAITPPAVLHPCSITYYSVDGKRLDKPEKGLNIIRMSDGTIRKVVVR